MNIKTFVCAISVFSSLITSSVSFAIDTYPTELDDLKSYNNDELEELYTQGTAFEVPSASQPGIELMHEGVPLPTPGLPGPSELLNFFWGGKAFYTDEIGATTLTNKVLPSTPVSFNNVSADVRIHENSLIGDGQPIILLDYSQSNISIARGIRDEVRLIAPGLYLGQAYMKNGFLTRWLTGKDYSFVLWFGLEQPY